LILVLTDAGFAQAVRHPFAVGGSEAAGAGSGLAGLVLAWQAKFHQQLQSAVSALKTDHSAFWGLALASFAYGVFHAAGPGHGKAVLASYMIANETALGRGLLLAALAAALQGVVAIAIVGIAALILNTTAKHMSDAAAIIETLSYGAILALGARLVWTKGRAFLSALRTPTLDPAGRYVCEDVDDPFHVHGADCGHMHAPDPSALVDDRFSWGNAVATVIAAGARPCSGAILILVFALSKGLFLVGVSSALLISAGTAITTGALAAFAVFAKDAALKLTRNGSRRSLLAVRGAEFAAALLVFALGAFLLAGVGMSSGGGA
jgi:ABC-type nickel/cobalt efflux system permease component RcnA